MARRKKTTLDEYNQKLTAINADRERAVADLNDWLSRRRKICPHKWEELKDYWGGRLSPHRREHCLLCGVSRNKPPKPHVRKPLINKNVLSKKEHFANLKEIYARIREAFPGKYFRPFTEPRRNGGCRTKLWSVRDYDTAKAIADFVLANCDGLFQARAITKRHSDDVILHPIYKVDYEKD